MITKRKILNFGFTTSLLAGILLVVLVLASNASAGNYAKKQADINSSNGAIHVVDTVILPAS